jgi:hypothetical protein
VCDALARDATTSGEIAIFIDKDIAFLHIE